MLTWGEVSSGRWGVAVGEENPTVKAARVQAGSMDQGRREQLWGLCPYGEGLELRSRVPTGPVWGPSELEDVLGKNRNLKTLNSHAKNPVLTGQTHVRNQNGLGDEKNLILYSKLSTNDEHPLFIDLFHDTKIGHYYTVKYDIKQHVFA